MYQCEQDIRAHNANEWAWLDYLHQFIQIQFKQNLV